MQWTDRRRRFRTFLEGGGCLHPASVFDPLSARIALLLGYEIGIFAGSTGSLTVLGAPDLVVLTATEFAQQAHRICRAADIPLLVDADHGYGNALNVARTIEELTTVGVCAATIEDTALPAPFGSSGKAQLISIEEGVGKMRAALGARLDPDFVVVGRTSAPQISTMDDAITRLKAYEAAGVDALFVVGLKTLDQLRAVASATKVPLIISNVSGELEQVDLSAHRVRVCLQGHLPIIAAAQAVYATMKALRDGTPPSEIANVASPSLMTTLTRDEEFQEAIREFLGAK